MTKKEKAPNSKLRGIYLLPNLLTTSALFAAFYAIVAAMKGFYDSAAIAIFVAMIADGLDGRVARLTNTETAFGVEYDSISDMVSFGLAPALVIYSWSLVHFGKVGWLIAFLYTACGALRLARFNTQVETSAKSHFQGLPIPSSAAILASFVWCCHRFELSGVTIDLIAAGLTIMGAILMVSNMRYNSFKEFDFKGRVRFVSILIIVLIFVGISIEPSVVLFLSFLAYAISGPIITFFEIKRMRSKRDKKRE